MNILQSFYDFMSPIAFWIGPFAIRWYSIGYILGFALGILVIRYFAKRWSVSLSTDNLLVILISIALGVIVGGRLGYVLFYGAGYYFSHPIEILAVNQGGMSFHGGLIGAIVGGFVASKIIKIPLIILADLAAVAVPIGIFSVRIANFINGELWGSPTEFPWGVVFEDGGVEPRHPTQLYEAFLEGAIMFAILFPLAKRKPSLPKGSYIGIFLLLYGVFRIAVEFVRVPDSQLGYLAGGWFTMGMLLSLPLIFAGVVLLFYGFHKKIKYCDTL